MKIGNVLSLFDGMSCGQIALRELGFDIGNYYASEIDQHAIKQTQHNFPNTIQLGSVIDVKAKDLPKIDLCIGGSPCQGFSFAGKQLNFNDERSKLFFEFVRLWNEIKSINPDAKFLLENVNMKKEYLRVISEYLGVFPVRINSNLVSAQNRDRWYWSNIRVKDVGLFTEKWTDIPQPEDEDILLKDILQPESEVDGKYYVKNPKIGFEGMDINGKGNNLRIGGKSSQSKKHNFDIIKLDKKGNQKPDQNKASCFTAGGNSGGNHSDMDIICVASRGRENKQELEPRLDNKTNCITSVSKDNLILQKPHGFNKGGMFKEKSPTVLSNSWEHNNHVSDGYKLRRLTPIECARLQTIPEWYEWIVSDTQIYRMLGNGWTVEVIKHIFKHL